jgi:hypothetical protein
MRSDPATQKAESQVEGDEIIETSFTAYALRSSALGDEKP